MTFSTRRFGGLAVILFLGSISTSAVGSVITQTQAFSFGTGSDATFTADDPPPQTGATVTSTPANAAGPLLTFSQFDDVANGPLASVLVSFDASLFGDMLVELNYHFDSFGPPVTVGMNGEIGLDFGLPGALPLSGLGAASVECTSFTEAGCSNTSMTSPFAAVSGAVSAGDLSPYIGTGTFDISTSLQALIMGFTDPDNGTDFIDNGTLNGLLSAISASGSVTVEYFFGVPEPGVLVLFLVGLPLLVRMSRKAR